MDDNEDFSFPLKTSIGERGIVMSRSNLSRIGGSNTTDAKIIVANYRDKILAIVERKIAKGRVNPGPIWIYGTDL